ncbi:hypothetical protein NM208_g12073 [Fusarium decemcellulare]|uniref:Uncharacterized protein n=1 Tax=Fusarium decemcellulare TaxID=57161 RepID=A0ACC1RRA4_9HYPO|nr:hypothetical protein NM208_g12073 [Fusarium decemcellulare]
MVSTRGSSSRDSQGSGSRKRKREDNPTRRLQLQLQEEEQRQSAAGARAEYEKSFHVQHGFFAATTISSRPPLIAWTQRVADPSPSVAKDRSWFADDYERVERQYTTGQGDTGRGMGMGTVVLAVRHSPDEDGPSSNGLLVLKNVVHAPNAPCNVIGRPITDDYRVTMYYAPKEVGDSGIITDHQGRQVAYFKPEAATKFPQLCLSEPPVGPRVRGPESLERLDLIDVSFREDDKWDEMQDSPKPSDALTVKEKKYLLLEYLTADLLCEHYGKDPNISKEREEAFRFMRLEMDEEMHIAAYGEPPRHWRHPAAHRFRELELDIMVDHSGGLQRFFQGHRLDPFNDEGLHIAKFLARLDPDENNLESWMDSPEVPALFKGWAERVGKDFMRRRYGVWPEVLWKSEDLNN